MADDHETLITVARRWERLYVDKCEECDELTTINEELHAETLYGGPDVRNVPR